MRKGGVIPALGVRTPLWLAREVIQTRGCSSSSSYSPTTTSSPSKSASQSPPLNEPLAAAPSAKYPWTSDWTPGSSYYFSQDEEERFFKKFEQHQPRRASAVARSGSGAIAGAQTDAHHGEDETAQEAPQFAEISGVGRSSIVDVSLPPLRREEAERWRLEQELFMRGIGSVHRLHSERRISLLPLTSMVTYLGDDMRKIDKAYRQSGYYSASEVAEALFPYVPTFPVEHRFVFRAIPASLMRTMEQHWDSRSLDRIIFGHYPMLFTFRNSRYHRGLVMLNSNYWFVRQHPSYGKADAMMRRHRYFENVTPGLQKTVTLPSGQQVTPMAMAMGDAPLSTDAPSNDHVPLRTRVFHVLTRNLPRVPTPPEEKNEAATFAEIKSRPYVQRRYKPLNLVQWVNSFSPEDSRVIKQVSEHTVVSVLCRYVNVFQLVSVADVDCGLFADGQTLLAAWARRRGLKSKRATSKERLSHGADPAQLSHNTDSAKVNPVDKHGAQQENEVEEEEEDNGDVTSAEGWDRDDQLNKPDPGNVYTATIDRVALEEAAQKASATASDENLAQSQLEEITRREALFKQALADDLIDVDGILNAEEGAGAAAEEHLAADDHDLDSGDAFATHTWGEEEEGVGEMNTEMGGSLRIANGNRSLPPSSQQVEGRSHTTTTSSRDTYAQDASVDEVRAFGLPLEDLYVRRLPPDVAPRSLSDFDETTSPDVELAALAARFLAPPPSVLRASASRNFFSSAHRLYNPYSPLLTLWRWVSVERLYHGYTVAQRHYLRREYKGLVNFLRYHGKLFELSNDLRYVIAHDPEGALAPFSIMERKFDVGDRVVLPRSFDDDDDESGQVAERVGERERAVFSSVLGEGSIPTCKRHILLLDPINPVFKADVLHEEIANLLPNHPVRTTQVLPRLPPLLRAALPVNVNFGASKYLESFTERGVRFIQRKSMSGERQGGRRDEKTPMSVEDAIGEVLQLPIGPDGVTLSALRFMHLSAPAVDTLCDHYGSLCNAFQAFPQYFVLDIEDSRRRIVTLRFRN